MVRPIALLAVLVALSSAAAPAAARTLVRYERTGGLAGFHDEVTVGTGGRVHVERRTGERRFTLSERRLRALRKAVREARFATLRERYAPPDRVADGFTETTRHAGHTVVVQTGAKAPARLDRLLSRLRPLLSER